MTRPPLAGLRELLFTIFLSASPRFARPASSVTPVLR
jgi:hypothetical protein